MNSSRVHLSGRVHSFEKLIIFLEMPYIAFAASGKVSEGFKFIFSMSPQTVLVIIYQIINDDICAIVVTFLVAHSDALLSLQPNLNRSRWCILLIANVGCSIE